MNYEEEREMARRIMGGLHGASLQTHTGTPAWEVNKKLAAQGTVTGFIAPYPGLNPTGQITSGIGHTLPVKSYADVTPAQISDAERMVQYLDKLHEDFKMLVCKAYPKLAPFCEPSPAAGSDEKDVDRRQCGSDYFRILESRIEFLQGHLRCLNDLIDSVTTYGSSGGLQASAGTSGY